MPRPQALPLPSDSDLWPTESPSSGYASPDVEVDLGTHYWLTGPVGSPDGIGADFFDLLARAKSLEVSEGGNPRGLIQDLSTLRSVEQKRALYARVASLLAAEASVRPEEVLITLVEVSKENWSFGNGIAQYAP